MKFKFTPAVWLALGILLLPLMITSESLWLDEGDTAMYALQKDFHSWRQHLSHDLAALDVLRLGNRPNVRHISSRRNFKVVRHLDQMTTPRAS